MGMWSKSQGLRERYPLLSHQLDTAASALALWDRWLRPGLRQIIEDSLGAEARAWVAFAAGQHDTGKANPVFQAQIGAANTEQWHVQVRKQLEAEGFSCEVPVERRMLCVAMRKCRRSSSPPGS